MILSRYCYKFEISMMKRLCWAVLFFVFIHSQLLAQGYYADFGQNRVQYRKFDWKKTSFENQDIIYYDTEDELASRALKTAILSLEQVEAYLSYKYGGTMQIVLFKNLTDYRQSNIGYENPQHSAGGFLMIPKDVSSVYFNGDYSDLERQIKKAVCDIIVREMMHGGTLQDRFESVRSPQLPLWFTEGLSTFLSQGWSAEQENSLMDAFATHSFSNFNSLSTEETILAGSSIWRYLIEAYGPESVGTLMFIARYTHSAEASIYFHTQRNMREFLNEWREFYSRALFANIPENMPNGTANTPGKIARKNHTDMALSPDGQKVAIVTNTQGLFDIWIFELQSQKVQLVYKGGGKVRNQVPDLGFPSIHWNPKDNSLYFATYEGGNYQFMAYKNEHVELIRRFPEFSGIVDFSIHPDGNEILISATQSGNTDLYTYSLSEKTINQLTQDYYFDHGGIYREDGVITYISNRPINDSLTVDFLSSVWNIFEYSNQSSRSITGFGKPIKIKSLISYSNKTLGFLADISGIFNAYALNTDSGNVLGQTNYKLGIDVQRIAADGKTLAEMIRVAGNYHIFTSAVPENPLSESVVVYTRAWKSSIGNLDSLFNNPSLSESSPLFGSKDSVAYVQVDSVMRNFTYQTGFPIVDYLGDNRIPNDGAQEQQDFKIGRFINTLQPDFLVSQSENRTLGSCIQSNFIQKEALRNPMVMPYVKVSLSDILKNCIVEGSFRSSLDLYISDYMARFAILKYRTDHEIIIGRHLRKYDESRSTLKQHLSTQLSYVASYPINEKARFSISPGVRQEFQGTKGSEQVQLNTPDIKKTYPTLNIEFVWDNTESAGLNMMHGIRGKGGIETIHSGIDKLTVANLFGDIRWYLPLWQNITLASRLSAAYGLGNGKVAYYLGGMENWTAKNQFEAGIPTFSPTPYMFQQWVSQLRGFSRGVRVGSNYVLGNVELRVPLVQTLVSRPLESEFFKNFTVTGFVDCGTAFVGIKPSDPANPFNTVYVSTPNYDLSVTSSRSPLAIGVGFGVRTRFLGYFLKFDRAKGYLENTWHKPMNYLSLGFDF